MSEQMCSCAGFCKGRDGLSDRYICGLERKPGKVFTPRDAKKSQPAPQEPSASSQPPSECVSYCRHDADTTKARCAWCKPIVWQEPSADTIQAVRALYRDDRDAMAHGLLQMRADLAEAQRER